MPPALPPSLSVLLLSLVAFATGSCSGTDSPEGSRDSGPCTQQEDITLRIGTGRNDFTELEPGAPLHAAFGSQLGLEVELLLATVGFRARHDAPVSVDVVLLVEDEPVGSYSAPSLRLRCAPDGSGGLLAVVFLLDVGNHSAFQSATQLDGHQALLRVTLQDDDARSITAEVDVVLEL